jgi:hypothetical protein
VEFFSAEPELASFFVFAIWFDGPAGSPLGETKTPSRTESPFCCWGALYSWVSSTTAYSFEPSAEYASVARPTVFGLIAPFCGSSVQHLP